MTTSLIGGHNLGLLDSSATILNRNDRTGNGTLGDGEEAYANVSNGNLIIQQHDAFLPSRGADFDLVRTYNSRGVVSGTGWSLSTGVTLQSHLDKPASGGASVTTSQATYGDGSARDFNLDERTGKPPAGKHYGISS